MIATSQPQVVAFYLPQFHAIPENDAAWGQGFTEWTNVRAATPRFPGHVQPAVPGELGYYSLLDERTRLSQQDLAARHGIDAFCWYHYWFDGRRLLHEPLDLMRSNRDESFPFMLCWANESWTRNWSGHSGEVIVEQRYSRRDDERHIEWMLPVLADRRYVRTGDDIPLLVYQPADLPDPAATFQLWRDRVAAASVGRLVILGVSSFRQRISAMGELGLDGVVEQQPDLNLIRPRHRAAPRYLASRMGLASRYPGTLRYPYARLATKAMRRQQSTASDPALLPTVCTGWDNSPRRRTGATVLTDATPECYERWLRSALDTSAPYVFVNAWNEWAEGAHLEPDEQHGRAYLEANARAVVVKRAAGT